MSSSDLFGNQPCMWFTYTWMPIHKHKIKIINFAANAVEIKIKISQKIKTKIILCSS